MLWEISLGRTSQRQGLARSRNFKSAKRWDIRKEGRFTQSYKFLHFRLLTN